MPYVQHTHCVPTQDYTGLGSALGIAGGVLAVLGILLASFFGGGAVGAALAAVGGMMAIFDVCNYLLGGKLICLGHDMCAIGLVVGLEPPGFRKPFPENIDNDYSVNILLSPHLTSASLTQMQNDNAQGFLISEQFASQVHDELGFKVYPSEDAGGNPEGIPVLHCEFEGDRIKNVCTTLKVIVPILTGLSAICAIPIIGWVICLIALLLSAAALAIVWAASGEGDPHDAGLQDGDLEVGQDYVIVRGDWCYDTGHTPGGWNEIHPVKYVQKLELRPELQPGIDHKNPFDEGSDPLTVDAFKNYLLDFCGETKKPFDPNVQIDQMDPPNRWTLHPVVDGCEEEDPVPVPK